jgi:O-antigen ligase
MEMGMNPIEGGPKLGPAARPDPLRGPVFPLEEGLEPTVVERLRQPLWVIGLTLAAVAFVLGSVYATYYLGQAPHRLWKVLGAILGLAVVLMRPEWSLPLIPFAFPYIEWLPKSPIPGLNTMNMLVLSLLASWLGRSVFHRRRFLDPSPWNRLLLVFLIWAPLTAIQGTLLLGAGVRALYPTMQNCWIGLSGFTLFFLVFNNVRTAQKVKTLSFLFAIAAGLGALGILREYAEYGGGRRVGGGLGDINRAGSFFACATLFTIEMLGGGFARFGQRLALAASLVGTLIGLALPASRGAIVAFGVALVPQTFRSGPFRLLLVVGVVGGFLLFAPGFVTDRMTETVDTVSEGGSTEEALNATSGGRIEIWTAVLRVIADHPLAGVGYTRLTSEIGGYLGRTKAGHNLYLETAAEMGIPGLILLLSLLGVAFWKSRDLLPYRGFPRSLALGYQYFLISLFVANLFGLRLYDFASAGSLGMLTALVFRARDLAAEGAFDDSAPAPRRPAPKFAPFVSRQPSGIDS